MKKQKKETKEIPTTYEEALKYMRDSMIKAYEIKEEDDILSKKNCSVIRMSGEDSSYYQGVVDALANIIEIPQKELIKEMKEMKKIARGNKQ